MNSLSDEKEKEQALSAVANYPSLLKMLEAQLSEWPEHARYLSTRFCEREPEALKSAEDIANLAMAIIGNRLAEFCADYRWMCDNFNEEQYYFVKYNKYRLSTFADAYAEIYNNAKYMDRYVHGILLSQVFWENHFQAAHYFRLVFLPANPRGARHLEVGPGHGLFLYFAAADERTRETVGWDVSKSSLKATRECLLKFGIAEKVQLRECDILNPPINEAERFDSILISEVLEHLEHPDTALRNLKLALAPEGRLLVNIPINSPAPDHIYLWRNPESVEETIRAAGFEVVAAQHYPATGLTLDEAMRRKLSVSCVITCRHA